MIDLLLYVQVWIFATKYLESAISLSDRPWISLKCVKVFKWSIGIFYVVSVSLLRGFSLFYFTHRNGFVTDADFNASWWWKNILKTSMLIFFSFYFLAVLVSIYSVYKISRFAKKINQDNKSNTTQLVMHVLLLSIETIVILGMVVTLTVLYRTKNE